MFYFHLGFSKSASTFIQSKLKVTEELNYVEKSYYFRDKAPNQILREEYLKFFTNSGQILFESDEHLIMPDICPILQVKGTQLRSIPVLIKKLKRLGKVRLILVLRSQTSVIKSRYSQYVLSGGNLSFEHFVAALHGDMEGDDYFQNYYSEIINLLVEAFGNENVLVLLNEELKYQPFEFEKSLADFIGVKKLGKSKDSLKSKRLGLSNHGMSLLRGINKVLVVEKETPFSKPRTYVGTWIYLRVVITFIRVVDYYILRKLNSSSMRDAEQEIMKRIREKFKADNLVLGSLLNKQIGKYGY